MKKPKPQNPRLKNEYVFRQIAPPALRKGELRKLEILEAAIRSLSKRGWVDTNYESVGRECGMKRPHVAYHYPQWNDLLLSALKMVYATGQAVVGDYLRDADATNPRSHLEAYVEGTFHWIANYPEHAAAVTLLWHLATFDENYKELNHSVKRIGVERVFAILFPGVPVKLESARGILAMNVHGMVVGRVLERLTAQLPVEPERTAREVSEAAFKMLQSARKEKRL